MDFIAARGFPLATFADSLRAASVGWRGERGFELKRFGEIELFVTDPMSLNSAFRREEHAPDDHPFYLFDGEFSAGEQFFHTLLKSSTAELQRRIGLLLEDDSANQEIDAGIFFAGRIDQHRLELTTDPLCQYPLYYFRSHERFILSNVLRQIAVVLAGSGLHVTPSLIPCLEGTLLGGSLGDSTHVAEISRLPFGHAVIANPYLHFRQRQSVAHALTYEETISRGRSALARHVRAVAAAVRQPRLIAADLTGGSDSRLVLSLLLDSPLRSELRGRCNTRYPDPDANVAGALVSKYNLPLAPNPHARRNNHWRRRKEVNAAFTGGAHGSGEQLPTIAVPNFIHFTGYFGEIGGATPGGFFVGETEHEGYSATRMVDIMISRRRNAALLMSREGINIVRRNAIATLIALEEEGVPREHLNAELYLRARCRSHFGFMNWIQNKYEIAPDPLASTWLMEARRKSPQSLHHKNKIVLDLMLLGSCEELPHLPMAEKVWDPSVIPLNKLEAFQQMKPITASAAALSSFTGPLKASIPAHYSAARPFTSESSAPGDVQAERSAAPSYDGQSPSVNQPLLKEMLERIPAGHDIWYLLDREAAIRYAHQEREAFSTTFSDRRVSQILTGMLWMLDRPAPPGIQEIKSLSITTS